MEWRALAFAVLISGALLASMRSPHDAIRSPVRRGRLALPHATNDPRNGPVGKPKPTSQEIFRELRRLQETDPEFRKQAREKGYNVTQLFKMSEDKEIQEFMRHRIDEAKQNVLLKEGFKFEYEQGVTSQGYKWDQYNDSFAIQIPIDKDLPASDLDVRFSDVALWIRNYQTKDTIFRELYWKRCDPSRSNWLIETLNGDQRVLVINLAKKPLPAMGYTAWKSPFMDVDRPDESPLERAIRLREAMEEEEKEEKEKADKGKEEEATTAAAAAKPSAAARQAAVAAAMAAMNEKKDGGVGGGSAAAESPLERAIRMREAMEAAAAAAAAAADDDFGAAGGGGGGAQQPQKDEDAAAPGTAEPAGPSEDAQ